MAVALRHIADIARRELVGAHAPVAAEYRHAPAALEIKLPLRCVRMPMQLAQSARLDDAQRPGDGGRDRELQLGYRTHGAAGEHIRLLGEQLIAMGERRVVERARRDRKST